MAQEALLTHATLIQRLLHQTCTSVGIGYASALLLDFGTASNADPSGYREPELSLVVECSWRLETEHTVLVGSGEDDDAIADAIQVLMDCDVETIKISQPSFSVRLSFGKLILWIFPDDARSYTDDAEFPRSPWYVTGHAIPIG
ncbi:MAG TPA: hypothetical protein VF201_01895 [Nitrolancea sp.]